MSSTTDKISGVANQAAGKVKESVGKMVGDNQMQAEGKVQDIKGKAQQTAGDVKSAVKDAANKNL